jgi:hypothetical protein
METIDQGETSMKPELLTQRDAAITTHEEETVRARTDELYEVRDRIDGRVEEDWLQAEGEVARSNERRAVQASTSDR